MVFPFSSLNVGAALSFSFGLTSQLTGWLGGEVSAVSRSTLQPRTKTTGLLPPRLSSVEVLDLSFLISLIRRFGGCRLRVARILALILTTLAFFFFFSLQ